MGGNISVESVYGKGSKFKVTLPQGYDSETPFASVDEPQKKKVLVFEGRTVYTQSVCWSLKNMGIPFIMTETLEDFSKALLRYNWYYIFTGYGLYNKVKPLLEKAVFPNGRRPNLALMVEWEDEAQIPNVRFISLPAQSLSIANVLNGKTDSRSYYSNQTSSLIRFTYPDARLLVVDDIATNLKVAEGLLAPYRAKVDTALNGRRAIDLIRQHKYDIVFMDHMMPEMDGIEATGIIRDMEEDPASNRVPVPIVALTANAISGMREMFLEKGFNDFLAKPIDVSKLDEMLDRWIPKDKRKKKSEQEITGTGDQGSGIRDRSSKPSNTSELYSDSPNKDPQSPIPGPQSPIPGVDIQKGISMTGGTMVLYRQVIGLFRKDAEDRLPILQNVPEKDALPGFVTQVHALKSASASVGAAEISAKAAKLEAAGKAADLAFIQENLPIFTKQLTELINGIKAWEKTIKEQEPSSGGNDQTVVTQLLQELSKALETEKADDIDRILEELTQQAQDTKIKEAIEKISDSVLMTEFKNAAEIVNSLL
jgi:CheY-like chemotaxis protein